MDYKNEPEDGSNFDLQGVNVKQEQDHGDGMNGAGDPSLMAADRNLPTAAPGEEGEYGYWRRHSTCVMEPSFWDIFLDFDFPPIQSYQAFSWKKRFKER